MPPGRSNRGGRRKGTPGTPYPNRSDLRSTQPIATAPGQAYGMATEQAKAQSIIPLANAQAGPTPVAGAQPSPPGLGAGPLPGSLGPLHAPTDRPGEPVTHGLPSGPGGGPQVLAPPDPLVKVAAVLNNLGGTADADTAKLREFVNATLGNRGAA